MTAVSVSIPEDIREVMNEFKAVDWSGVARRAISEKARQLAFLKYFKSESELTEKDALELGMKVNKAVSEKYRGM